MSPSSRPGPVAQVLLALLRGYRLGVSPLLGPRCRFEPSCSAYAVDAVTSHGAWRGSLLSVRRVGRCHPFHSGGYDPVPPPRPGRTERRRRPPDRPTPDRPTP
jgi:uncharacterized protein